MVKEDQTGFVFAFTSDSFSLIGRNMVAFNSGKGNEYFLSCFVSQGIKYELFLLILPRLPVSDNT